jgi:16S rRNA processing protein RimM
LNPAESGEAVVDAAPRRPAVGERLTVAFVRGIHGLRGAVRVEALTDRSDERFRVGARLYREGTDDPLTIVSAHPDDPGWLMRFREVVDRTAADGLRESYLEAVVEPGEELPRGEYYWHEVIGSRVLGLDGAELGTVVDVYRAGGAEVLVVRGQPYGEFDLPAVRAFVRIFAPARGEIVADVEALELTPPKPRRARGRRSSKLPAGQVPAGTAAGAAAAATAGDPAAAEVPATPAAEPASADKTTPPAKRTRTRAT